MAPRTLSYSFATLWPDYVRGGVGAALCLVPVVVMETGLAARVILVLVAGLFTLLIAMAAKRQRTRLVMTDDSVCRPGPVEILRWDQLDGLDLAYFSTRGDARNGWMQLTLCAGAKRVRVDSKMTGFQCLLVMALQAYGRRSFPLSTATAANLHGYGVLTDMTSQQGHSRRG